MAQLVFLESIRADIANPRGFSVSNFQRDAWMTRTKWVTWFVARYHHQFPVMELTNWYNMEDCTQKNERENFNWEKHRMLEDCWHRSRMEGEERTFDRIYQEDDVFLFHPELVGGQGFSPVWLAKQDYLKSSQNFSYVMMLARGSQKLPIN